MIKKWGIIMTLSKEDYKHIPEISDIENKKNQYFGKILIIIKKSRFTI